MQPADRTRLRMERLRQLELEQLQWEQEALVMPEDLNRALFLSFESVKTEFSDLDGLSWSRWAIEEPTPKLACTEIDDFPTVPDRPPAHSPPHRPPSRSEPSFTPQDTIRVSRITQSRSPLQPANQFFSTPSRKDPHAHRSVSPYSLPPANLALACHGLRHPAYGHS